MDEFVKAHWKIGVDTTLKSLEKHGFEAHYFDTKRESADFIVKQAENCQSIGIGGTHTVRMLDVLPKLEEAGKKINDHWPLMGSPGELDCRKQQMLSDLFLTSTNAITMTGEIVNREGCGNRTNSMTFGPGKVIIVAGKNKIVPDLDAALTRIEEVAGPIRAMSLNRKTPCVKSGYCMDCDSPERICRITSIIHRQPMLTKIIVVIIGEDLGY
jgi:hypothetical protein